MTRLLSSIILLLTTTTLFSQNLSNKGKEFWVGYGHHQYFEGNTGSQQNSQEMVLYISAEQPAVVKVSIAGTVYSQTYNIPANTVISTGTIPKAGLYDCRLTSDNPAFVGTLSEGKSPRGIHIESNVPVVAYSHIYGSASSGASMLMPVETWGYSYVALNSMQNYGANNCFSWVYVVANEDNTVVEITPSELTRGGQPADVPFQVTLNKGEIYQVLGALILSNQGFDMTGTTVKSIANSAGECHPIGVFSGSSRTYITCSGGAGGGGDNIMQQIFPSQAWGKRYLTAPTSNNSSASALATNIYRILVKDPTTKVYRNGVLLTGIIDNFYYTYNSNTADYIEADKPVLVGQYMSSNGGCPGTSGNGDPEMMYISPIEQAIKRVGFYRNTLENITTNYLTLIIPTSGLSSLTIDGVGSSGFTYTYPHPNIVGYTVVIKRWTSAQTQCIVQSDQPFTAITYGLGSVESYGYNAGTLINNLNVIGSVHNTLDTTTTTHQYTCRNTPAELSVFVAYQPTNMVWELSQVPQLNPNADVTVSGPVPIDSMLQNGTWYYQYTLPGTYTFSDTGSFEITIKNTHPSIENCNNTEEVKFVIVVKPNPKADFTIQHTGCRLDTVQFFSPANTGNGYTIDRWLWTFPDASQSTDQNPLKLFTTDGLQNIQLNVVSTEGCVGDTLRPLTIHAPPTTTFTNNPAAICEGNTVSFTSSSAYTGTSPVVNDWYWDFGTGTPGSTDGAPQSITYASPGTYTVKHVVKVSNNCISDTATQTVVVYSKPAITFTYPAGCLPVDGNVFFNNTTSVPDGQTLSYNWNFGDPNATGTNPNTSTAQSPSHNYNYGTYNISLSVSTDNGCVKDSTFSATFNVKPLLAFTPITDVCESVASVSVANGSVTNSVPGDGYYVGPGTDSAGVFQPGTAGPGSHTIWYVFNSDGGCKDSLSQDVFVHAKPKAEFTFPAGCLPVTGLVQFQNTTTIADGQSMTYSWNFNDPNAGGANPNTSTALNPTHNYTNTGSYNINLTATSVNGCVDDTTITTTFSVKPLLAFPAISSVCQNITTGSVATATVSNNVTGTGVYSGPGTQGNGNFNPSAAGAGTHTIWYKFTSTGGCVDSVSSTIKVFPKPVSNFNVNSDICLNQSATVSDNSTLSAGNITTWNWNFGNNTTASNNNNSSFQLNYSNWNTYTIKLVTISDSSCVSDTFSKTIAVHPLPVASFTPPAFVCMPNGSASFVNSSSVADNSSMTYSWDFGDGSAASTQTSPSHIYNSGGSYNIRLTSTSAYGCVKDTVQVLSAFYDKPVALFSVSPDTLCQGTDNVFSNTSYAPNSTVASWNWSFGDGSTASTESPVKKYSQPGNYTVTLTVSNAVGCTSDPYTDDVIVYVQPVINAGPSFVVPQGTTVTFNPTVNDSVNVSFVWTPSSYFSDPTKLRQSLVAMFDETFTLTATGDGNCTASDEMTVKILRPVTVPNAFSPNGDGINDTWQIDHLADYPGCSVEVFNRYGQMVFKSNGYGTPWNGTHKGNPLPFATYYYVIVLKNGFVPLTGSVTIVK